MYPQRDNDFRSADAPAGAGLGPGDMNQVWLPQYGLSENMDFMIPA
jgi:hypothetical protein